MKHIKGVLCNTQSSSRYTLFNSYLIPVVLLPYNRLVAWLLWRRVFFEGVVDLLDMLQFGHFFSMYMIWAGKNATWFRLKFYQPLCHPHIYVAGYLSFNPFVKFIVHFLWGRLKSPCYFSWLLFRRCHMMVLTLFCYHFLHHSHLNLLIYVFLNMISTYLRIFICG